MSVTGFLKSLSYWRPVRSLARWARVNGFLRAGYYAFMRPRTGILTLEVCGLRAQYRVRTPGELRVVDLKAQRGGELRVLEAILPVLRPGDTVFDIGAHIGLYTLLLARAVTDRGAVIAFEPSREPYEHLKENVELNELRNVRIFKKALGDYNGQGVLRAGEENTEWSLLRSPPSGGPCENVDIVIGDKLVLEGSLPIPRFVKIDVEGFEDAVIRGLRETLSQPGCSLIACEVHPALLRPGVTVHGVLELLRAVGFARLDVSPHQEIIHVLGWKESIAT